ncbi:MAG: hypothetical protein KIH69_009045 [Anaerolineae bacterium]|nr:hypothetical protein [Anaerolineae bacterium]
MRLLILFSYCFALSASSVIRASDVVPPPQSAGLMMSEAAPQARLRRNQTLDVTIASVYVRDANTHEAISSAKSGDDFEFVICVNNSSGEEESISLSWVATAPNGSEYGPFTRKRQDKTIGDDETCYDNGRLEFPYNSQSGSYSFLGILHATSVMTGSSLLTTVDVTAINTQPAPTPVPASEIEVQTVSLARDRAGEGQVTEIQVGSPFYPVIHWENKANTPLTVTWYVNVYYNDLVIMHQHGTKEAEPGQNDWGMALLGQADWLMPSDAPLGAYTLKGAICGGSAIKNAFSNCKELATPFSVVEMVSTNPPPPARGGGGKVKRLFLPVIQLNLFAPVDEGSLNVPQMPKSYWDVGR